MIILSTDLKFPPVTLAEEDGLLCMGGDLSVERLKLAYQEGIFPWYNEGEPILWYSPDPRVVLFLDEIHVSRSMRALFLLNKFHCTINKCFDQVITECQTIKRVGQSGTWITEEMKIAYCAMHQQGLAYSVECWQGDRLVGGLYGIQTGQVFSGESMFSHVPNASKYALIYFATQLKEMGVKLIDCQVYSAHLGSLGARMIDRTTYLSLLKQ